MKSLITGASGFVGPYLAKHLIENKHEVFGLDLSETRIKGVISHTSDMCDKEKILEIVNEIKPHYIFHLAAQSSPEKSFSIPEITMNINVNGTKNLLDAVIKSKIDPTLLVVSSALVYGAPRQIPIKEDHPLQPTSPYAESKVEQERLCIEYYKKSKVKIIIARSFNHAGPGQQPMFVCSDFAKQIADIEKGTNKPVISVGNLEARRDFTDVRDIVKAYLLAVERGEPGQIYNICSGKAYSIKQILDILLSMSKTNISIEKDQKKQRVSDIPVLLGDNTRFRKITKWKPEIPFEKTLKDLLEYWRKNI